MAQTRNGGAKTVALVRALCAVVRRYGGKGLQLANVPQPLAVAILLTAKLCEQYEEQKFFTAVGEVENRPTALWSTTAANLSAQSIQQYAGYLSAHLAQES